MTEPFQPPPDYGDHPELAVAALLHMLVRFPAVRCDALADSIAAHLQLVAGDARFPEAVRAAAQRSWGEWEAMNAARGNIPSQVH